MRQFLPLSTIVGVLCFCGVSAHAFDSAGWADRMASPDENTRTAAVQELHGLNGSEKEQAAAILGSVLHRGPVQAQRAAQALTALGPAAEPALLDLIYALSYDEESVAVAVSSVVVPMGGHAVSALRRTLDDPNFFIRRRAADILGQIGPAAAPATKSLVGCLNDPQYEVKEAAQKAIIRIGPSAITELEDAYPNLEEALRRTVVQMLGKYGPPAVPTLINIAKKDPSGFVRVKAMETLAQIQPVSKEGLQVFIASLSDMDEGVRGAAADALGTVGHNAQPAVSKLKRMATGDPDSLVRQKASDALSVIVSSETSKK